MQNLHFTSNIEANDLYLKKTRVTTADVEQTTVAAFLPWRGS